MRTLPLALALLLAPCADSRPAAPPRPDILLIMPDQMRGDCLSALGHPAVRTPQLDALAARGTLFRRAYSTIPSCIPARHALLTGLFPQTSGIVGFKSRPIPHPTLPKLLGDAGYATALVGRTMHQVPGDAPYGYQRQILGSTYVEGDDYDLFLQKAAPETDGIRRLVGALGVSYNGWKANPWPLADDLHPTAWIVARARGCIAESVPSKPLFLTASFYAPHPPLFPPRKFFDAQLARADLPPPARGDWVDWDALTPEGDRVGHRVRLEGETLRRTRAGYFGLIDQIDAQLGPLIEAFTARSRAAGRSWVVALCSDHGEMLGDHGFFRKCEPFEGSANIPFVIAGSPDLGFQPGQRCSQPVCLEDLLPTFLDLAGAPIPATIDGVSLVPALRGERRVIREWLHLEHAPCYGRDQAFHALTDGRRKYIWRPADGAEHLFDLDRDPREERDLSRDPGNRGALAEWRARMIRRLAGRPEGFSDGMRLLAGRPYPQIQKPRALPEVTGSR